MKDGIYRYVIEMTAPLGKRKGELELIVKDRLVNGFLTMFTNTIPITQALMSGNRIHFNGEMSTLAGAFSYEAEGTVSKSKIELLFRTDSGDYPAVGTKAFFGLRRGACV